MATTSTASLAKQLRSRLLTYAPPASAPTLNTMIGGRLYIDRGPDVITFEYGIMRLINRQISNDYDPVRETPELEIQLYANNASRAQALEGMADVCDMAMTDYKDATSGLTFSRGRRRDTLPPFTDPADREIIAIRLVYELVVWPLYLNTLE